MGLWCGRWGGSCIVFGGVGGGLVECIVVVVGVFVGGGVCGFVGVLGCFGFDFVDSFF